MRKPKSGAVGLSEARMRLAEEIRREVERLPGPTATFEQRRDAAAALMAEALAKVVDEDQAEGHRQRR